MKNLATETAKKSAHQCGYVTILGHPNVGKSTLLNTLLGEKIAITTPWPQTTRNRLTGIFTSKGTQIIFVDTPGIPPSSGSKKKIAFQDFLIEEAKDSLFEVDCVLFVIDASQGVQSSDEALWYLVQSIKNVKSRTLIILNKIDRLANRNKCLPIIREINEITGMKRVIPCSCKTGEGIDEVFTRHQRLSTPKSAAFCRGPNL